MVIDFLISFCTWYEAVYNKIQKGTRHNYVKRGVVITALVLVLIDGVERAAAGLFAP